MYFPSPAKTTMCEEYTKKHNTSYIKEHSGGRK